MRTPICAWYGNGGSYDPEPPPEEKPPPSPPDSKDDKKPAEPPKKQTSARHALVIGRFMPPHAGHQHLVDVARSLASTVSVLVRTTPEDPIAPDLRLAWLHELFGERIAALTGEAPQQDTFWQGWRDLVGRALSTLPAPANVDLLVSSDREAWRLAELLGARHALVDPDRLTVPISATAIRRDPHACWTFLPPPVRAHYARRVVLIGPESSGKSTFARELARALDTTYVPEQARLFAERCGTLRECDLSAIAELQLACEDAAARRANRHVIADTDVLSLRLWAERLFGRAPALPVRVPDLYLVTDPALPFAGSADRDDPRARTAFAGRCLEAARASGARVVELPAEPAARMAVALDAIRR